MSKMRIPLATAGHGHWQFAAANFGNNYNGRDIGHCALDIGQLKSRVAKTGQIPAKGVNIRLGESISSRCSHGRHEQLAPNAGFVFFITIFRKCCDHNNSFDIVLIVFQ
jgi:hypothetical protein